MLKMIRALIAGQDDGDQTIGRRLRDDAARYQPEIPPALRARVRAALAAEAVRGSGAAAGARIGWMPRLAPAVAVAAVVAAAVFMFRPRARPDYARIEADRAAVRAMARNLLPGGPLAAGEPIRAVDDLISQSLHREFDNLMADAQRGARAVFAVLPARPASGGNADF